MEIALSFQTELYANGLPLVGRRAPPCYMLLQTEFAGRNGTNLRRAAEKERAALHAHVVISGLQSFISNDARQQLPINEGELSHCLVQKNVDESV
jgi:hypothetical protein